MRKTIVFGILAAALCGAAPASVAAPGDFAIRGPQARAPFTPVPKFQLAACRFWQCNCHPECVIYQGDRCVRSVQSCETCSKCDD